MARDHARIKLRIWDDEDWRDLTGNAQHLYMLLLTHPTLSYCGVADWRPARLTGLVKDWDADTIQAAADELMERLYIVADVATEEVLLRSFVRNDELMKQPKMASAMANAYSSVGSAGLRGVVVHELIRLHEEQPELNGWKSEKARALLNKRPIDPTTYPCGKGSVYPSVYPSGKGSPTGTPNPSGKGPVKDPPTPCSLLPTPTPAPSTSNEVEKELLPRKRGNRLPDDFSPDDNLRAWAKGRGFNDGQIDEMTERFADYWHSATGAKAAKSNWNLAWRGWVSKEDPRRVRGAASMYDTGKLPEPGMGWSADQLDMVLGKDTWTVPEPPAEMNEDDGFLWQQSERRRHFALRIQDALKATGRTA